MWFVPHTPRWLIQAGREDRARDMPLRTRPAADIDGEVGDIKDTV